jgi:1-hydroxycarotenoid 3,4-desaturase
MKDRFSPKVIVVGAGMGGLSAAIRLAAAGLSVSVIETQDSPGGKMRSLPSTAGPVDAGPTVLTLRSVFDALFELAGGSPAPDRATNSGPALVAGRLKP